jgi:hypothetical protein
MVSILDPVGFSKEACDAFRLDMRAAADGHRLGGYTARTLVEFCRVGMTSRPGSPLFPIFVEVVAVDTLLAFWRKLGALHRSR